MTKPIYGLLLAGGESRRMGRDKALLTRNGESQLTFAAGLLDRCTDRVFVSAREQQAGDSERSRHDLIIDRYANMGPVAGILSAMEEYPDADWLVVACDLPNISASTLEYLLEHRDSAGMFVAYRSSYDQLPEPLCALYKCGSQATVRQFVDDGIFCPRKILIRSDTLLLEQQQSGSLDNINTPDDLSNSVLQANQ